MASAMPRAAAAPVAEALFKCRDCGEGVDDPTTHVCGAGAPGHSVGPAAKPSLASKTYSTYQPPPLTKSPKAQPEAGEPAAGSGFLSNSYQKLFGGNSQQQQQQQPSPKQHAYSPSSGPHRPGRGHGHGYGHGLGQGLGSSDGDMRSLTSAMAGTSISSPNCRASRMYLQASESSTYLSARDRGGINLSDIMLYKDVKSADCASCRGMVWKGEEIVCVGVDLMHATCCICSNCGLSVDRDEYGSDGWVAESDGSIWCADCIARRDESEAAAEAARHEDQEYNQHQNANGNGASKYSPPSPVSPGTAAVTSFNKQADMTPPVPPVPEAHRGTGGGGLVAAGGDGSQCGTCHLPIQAGAPAVTHSKLVGAHHPRCLTCQHCRRPLSDTFGPTNPAHVRHGAPLCHPCYLATLPRCGGCQAVITRDTRVCAALGKKYHPACFVCTKCGANFPDKSFYVLRDAPFCRWCYHEENGSICGGCARPIEGACACVVEGRFHPKCFVCATCRVPLADVYYACEGKPYCERHVRDLQRRRGAAAKAERRQTLYRNV